MNIVKALPPNYSQILQALPGTFLHPDTIFTYGDTIYNPGGGELTHALLAHEWIHSVRQTDPQAWWDLYLTDTKFLLSEELLAHRAEYQDFAYRCKDKEQRFQMLRLIAGRLSG